MFSNRYIFIYSAVLVTIVAIILSAAATLLMPYQKHNERVEKMKGILESANIPLDGSEITDLYGKYIREEWVINSDGDVVGKYVDGKQILGDIRAFDIDLKDALNLLDKGDKEKALFPIYLFSIENESGYIIPLLGKGLWGPVWGNMALATDLKTVKGATFDHKSETPGLGAEISSESFQNQFKGKVIFDKNNAFTSILVVKGGVAGSKVDPSYGVDAISGGTITSDGVTEMIHDVLSVYLPFIKKHIEK